MNKFLKAALRYAGQGLHVFPLQPGKKVPLKGSQGFKDASTDPAIIRRWWTDNPLSNIGLACGASNIFVVDIDTKDGKPGLMTWHELAASLGIPESDTLTNITPTGGKHLVYLMPEGVRLGNTAGKIGEGLDTRGDGGYIVAPPSIIGGKPYRWEAADVQPAPCPAPLVELLTREELPPHPWEGQRSTFADMLAHEPEPPRWIVEGFLEAGSLVIVYGKAGSLKSMLIADLALCVASGVPWLAPEIGELGCPLKVEPCTVMWCDLDIGAKSTHIRIRALAAAHGITTLAPITFFSFPALDLANADSVVALRDAILLEGAKVVVIDTFINATTIQNENDNAQLRAPMYAMRTLCEQTGAAIIAIHHPSKGTQPGKDHDDLRGGGAIAGAADLTLRVVRDDPTTGDVTITATKTRGAEVAPLSAVWSYERDLARNLTSGRFHGKRHESPAQKADKELEEKVLYELAEGHTGPSNQTELRRAVGCKNERLVKLLRRLAEESRVTITPDKKRGKVYSISCSRSLIPFHSDSFPEQDRCTRSHVPTPLGGNEGEQGVSGDQKESEVFP